MNLKSNLPYLITKQSGLFGGGLCIIHNLQSNYNLNSGEFAPYFVKLATAVDLIGP